MTIRVKFTDLNRTGKEAEKIDDKSPSVWLSPEMQRAWLKAVRDIVKDEISAQAHVQLSQKASQEIVIQLPLRMRHTLDSITHLNIEERLSAVRFKSLNFFKGVNKKGEDSVKSYQGPLVVEACLD